MRPYVTVTARFLVISQTDFRGSLDEPHPAPPDFVKPAGTTPADENHN
jgi:hypothetical protein